LIYIDPFSVQRARETRGRLCVGVWRCMHAPRGMQRSCFLLPLQVAAIREMWPLVLLGTLEEAEHTHARRGKHDRVSLFLCVVALLILSPSRRREEEHVTDTMR